MFLESMMASAKYAAGVLWFLAAAGAWASESDRLPRWGWFHTIERPFELRELRAAGANFVIPYRLGSSKQEVLRYLDQAHEAGLEVTLSVGGSRILDDPEDPFLKELLSKPALRAWYLADEPDLNGISPKALQESYQKLRLLPKVLPVWMVIKGRGKERSYGNAYDLFLWDSYPVRQATAEYEAFATTDFFRGLEYFSKSLRHTKPFGFTLQGFGSTDEGQPLHERRLPTLGESRVMLYAALLTRPSQIVYFAYHIRNRQWMDSVFGPLVGEYRQAFEPFLHGENFTYVPLEDGLELRGTHHRLVFFVNTADRPLHREWKEEPFGVSASRGVSVENGEVRFDEDSYAVGWALLKVSPEVAVE